MDIFGYLNSLRILLIKLTASPCVIVAPGKKLASSSIHPLNIAFSIAGLSHSSHWIFFTSCRCSSIGYCNYRLNTAQCYIMLCLIYNHYKSCWRLFPVHFMLIVLARPSPWPRRRWTRKTSTSPTPPSTSDLARQHKGRRNPPAALSSL